MINFSLNVMILKMAGFYSSSVVLIVVLFAGLQLGISSPVGIHIDPMFAKTAQDEAINFSCSVDSTVGTVILVELMKNGTEPVAFLGQDSKLSLGQGYNGRVVTNGYVNMKDPSESYLNVTLLHPTSLDSGQYNCILFHHRKIGVIREEIASQQLQVDKSYPGTRNFLYYPGTRFLPGYPHSTSRRRIARSQSYEFPQHAQINLTTGVKFEELEFSSLGIVVTDLMKRIASLEKDRRDRYRERLALKKKDNPMSAFSVTNNYSNIYLSKAKVIAFPGVIVNLGGDYNKTRGTFTAPRAGLYAFNLVISFGCTYARHCDGMKIALKKNDQVFAILALDTKKSGDQTSVSSLVELGKGDEVTLAVYSINSGVYITSTIYSSLYTGYLVKAY